MHRWEGNCLADLIHLGLGSPRKVILHIFFGWRRSLLRCSVLARWRRKKGVCAGNLFWTRREWRSPRKTQHPTHCQTLKIILKTLMLYRSFKIPFICRCKSDIYFRIGTLVLNLEKGPRMWQGFFSAQRYFLRICTRKTPWKCTFFAFILALDGLCVNSPEFAPIWSPRPGSFSKPSEVSCTFSYAEKRARKFCPISGHVSTYSTLLFWQNSEILRSCDPKGLKIARFLPSALGTEFFWTFCPH